ncbi:hypothetical protein FAM09_18710 [Niastella caeni]|uniref:FTP domain-containing protein n=1 Tax=Niastella caeni TaxID=2569763 RepID=A0A4S8HR28_9BACT|nr:hypothetical protein [Niastella caeni]THU36989.1 hypothetical protein FAM09_18710 [Niastella caeni]
MKYLITLLIVLPLFMGSCKKDHEENGEDYGCIERIFISPKDHDIKSTDVPIVDKLFSDNGIDNSNFRYARYFQETRNRQYQPFELYNYKNVRVDQYKNGLRVFNAGMIFAFVNDKQDFVATNPVDVSGLDTVAHLTLPRLRKLFSDELKRSYAFHSQYADFCFEAEFGYYKKSIAIGNNENKTVKAWRVTIKGHRDVPAGYYADENGKLIFFDSGIIID